MEITPEVTLLTALGLGFLLGLRHALDADHIVAVTTIVSQGKSLIRSAMVGLTWGLGHALTLLAAGFAVLAFRLVIPSKFSLAMEFTIGVILVLLGIPLVRRMMSRTHTHWHQHGQELHEHSHSHQSSDAHEHRHLRRPFLLGMVHGLAGSGVLTVMVLSAMPSVGEGLMFLLIFSVGSILAMLIFGGLIGLPFKLTAERAVKWNVWIQGAAGLTSVVLGLFIMWRAAVVEQLFHLV